jgi:hypothetical protein
MKLSDQAIGALMTALQKSLLEQTDIVPVLKSMEFQKTENTKRWGTKGGELAVANPPVVCVANVSIGDINSTLES